MRRIIFVALVCGHFAIITACGTSADRGSAPLQQDRAAELPKKVVQVDWRAKLEALQKQLAQDPNSAFLHSQVATAYEGLGDFENFDREINLAINLDKNRATYCYFAFAVYKQRNLRDREIAVLERALKLDPANPFGHYQRAGIFEQNKKWKDALVEFETTKTLLNTVKQDSSGLNYSKWSYIDPFGNPYDVTFEKEHIDDDIARVRTTMSDKK